MACLLLANGAVVWGQSEAAKVAPAATSKAGEREAATINLGPEMPSDTGASTVLHGWNAGLTISGLHDAVTGWATLANPAADYSFNNIFSVDVTVPIYFYRLAESIAARPKANALLVNQRGEVGDTVLSLHAQFVPKLLTYELTGAVTAPSGDEAYGLTTGRVTFDIDNRFEHNFGRVTPVVSLGGGDSTTLVNRVVTRSFTSLGPLSHFLVGVAVDPFRKVSFEVDAYEQLPIGDQKIYGPSRRNRPPEVIGHHVTEDNGFTTALEIAVDRHTSIWGYYNRSLRLHDDTVQFGVTYFLRAPPAEDDTIDNLFR